MMKENVQNVSFKVTLVGSVFPNQRISMMQTDKFLSMMQIDKFSVNELSASSFMEPFSKFQKM